MSFLADLEDALKHPVTWALTLIGSIAGSLGWLGAAWEPVATTSGTWFPAIATFAATILPNIGPVLGGNADLGKSLLVIAGSVFVVIQLNRLYQYATEDD